MRDNKNTYANYGNFSFGASGTVIGDPTLLLQYSAGVVQAVSNNEKKKAGLPYPETDGSLWPPQRPFNDAGSNGRSVDQEQLTAGSTYVYTHYWFLLAL